MKKILVTLPLEETALARARALAGVEIEVVPVSESDCEVPAHLRDADVLFCKAPPANFDDLVAIEFMQIATVGFEHLRDLKLGDRSLRVCNARGIFDTAIAEWNLAMMIDLRRDLRAMIRNQERAHWEKSARFQQEIRNAVVGLWGYGGIGRETARLAKAFGMTVHVLTRTGIKPRRDDYTMPGTGDPDGTLPDAVFHAGQELDFLHGLDHLVLALPLNQNTDGIVGERELRALPSGAFVLNPARGPIVEEKALIRALREGWIAGAALDTHYAYPLPPEHPLWGFPNVILTPHISGADRSQHFQGRIGDLFARNLERFLTGQSLLNEVTKREWRET